MYLLVEHICQSSPLIGYLAAVLYPLAIAVSKFLCRLPSPLYLCEHSSSRFLSYLFSRQVHARFRRDVASRILIART